MPRLPWWESLPHESCCAMVPSFGDATIHIGTVDTKARQPA